MKATFCHTSLLAVTEEGDILLLSHAMAGTIGLALLRSTIVFLTDVTDGAHQLKT